MKKGNGIHPIVALILTALVCVLAVLFFTGGHIFWGVVFALITLDFLADLILSLRSFEKEKQNAGV